MNSESKLMRRTGWALTILTSLFLLWDSSMKLIQADVVLEAMDHLGYPQSQTVGIGLLCLFCMVLYAIPVTSVLGAVLMTGYLGGAIASHIRAGDGAFPVTFALVFATMIWLGIYLREPRLWALLPRRR